MSNIPVNIKAIGTKNLYVDAILLIKNVPPTAVRIPTGINSPVFLTPNIYSCKRPTAGARINKGHNSAILCHPKVVQTEKIKAIVNIIPPGTNNPGFLFLDKKKPSSNANPNIQTNTTQKLPQGMVKIFKSDNKKMVPIIIIETPK